MDMLKYFVNNVYGKKKISNHPEIYGNLKIYYFKYSNLCISIGVKGAVAKTCWFYTQDMCATKQRKYAHNVQYIESNLWESFNKLMLHILLFACFVRVMKYFIFGCTGSFCTVSACVYLFVWQICNKS